MKYFLCFFVFYLSSQCCFCQYNLVPNYSFEDSVICPSGNNQSPIPKPWYIPSSFNTNFYFNNCSIDYVWDVPLNYINDSSFQYPKSGNGYAAFDTYIPSSFGWRTYIQVKLKDSLQTGKCYHCTFWVSLGNPCGFATNNISLWLSKTAKYVDTIADPFGLSVIPASPQVYSYGNPVIKDTQNWIKVSSVYVAQGGERFITIGNFKNDANTLFENIGPNTAGQTLYYVDDVSIIPLDSLPLKADAGQDATIALGDSVFIGSLTNGITNITWYNSSGAVINTTAPGFYVSPTVSTFYVVEQTVCGYYSRDTVYVNVGAMPVHLLSFTAQPTSPATVALQWTVEAEQNFDNYEVQRSINGRSFITTATIQGNNSKQYSCLDKIYTEGNQRLYYRLKMVDKDGKYNYSPIETLKLLYSKSFTIYPNPAQTNFKLKMNKNMTGKMSMVITDVSGRVMLHKNYASIEASINVSVNELSDGIYTIKITGKDEQLVHQLVIMK